MPKCPNIFAVFVTTCVCCLSQLCCYGIGIPFDVDKAATLIEASAACHSNPAVAVAVVKDGQVLLSRGFGVTDLESQAKVSSDTLFGIASITKSFTATLMVKLLHENTNLTVNSRVSELLGGKFQMPDDFRTSETTFADLLAHRTAVPPNNKIRYDTNLTRENLVERLPMLTSPQQFRVDYMYSNLMYGLLTRLIEIIGKDQWEDLISRHLFRPLGMDRSTFATRVNFDLETNRAMPYMELDGPGEFQPVPPELSRRWAMLAGSGSVMSTSDDMTKWLNFHLSGGKNEQGEQVMPPDAFAELHKQRFLITPLSGKTLDVPTFPYASLDTDYAFGLRRGYYRGYQKITHSGSTAGFRSLMTLLPTENIGVIALLNGRDDHYLHRIPLNLYLLDNALGLEPWLNHSTICTYPEPWKERPNVPRFRPKKDINATLKLESTEYEGLYRNDAYGDMTIEYNDTLDSLTMSYGFGKWELVLWSTSGDVTERFFAKGIAPVFPFDTKPIYFLTHPQKHDVIVGVKASGFETRVPPVFCRPGHVDVCREAMFNEQKFSVGSCRHKGCESNHGFLSQPINIMYFASLVVVWSYLSQI